VPKRRFDSALREQPRDNDVVVDVVATSLVGEERSAIPGYEVTDLPRTSAGTPADGGWFHTRVEEIVTQPAEDSDDVRSCRSVEWYTDGQVRVVDVNGVRVVVRFVGRKGRRARIAITAPPGAVFRATEGERPSGGGEPP
jgi:hypothetical protein